MNYASYTRETREPLKRIAHGRRFFQIVKLISPLETDIVLDYGCGDAHLFSHFPAHKNLIGYDPNPVILSQAAPDLAHSFLTTDIEVIKARYAGLCSLIYCTEVCEHLNDKALSELLANIKTLAAPNARIVFGVPIETGLSGFIKELYRMTYGRGSTLANAISSLFSFRIYRKQTDIDWFGNHTGFDYSTFRRRLVKDGFKIERERCLPISLLGTGLNNEIYYICSIVLGDDNNAGRASATRAARR